MLIRRVAIAAAAIMLAAIVFLFAIVYAMTRALDGAVERVTRDV